MMTPNETERLVARIDRLERSHHRWKVGAVLVAAIAVLVLGARPQSLVTAQGARTIAAQRFLLLSPGGQSAGAALQFSDRGPELVLLDPGEKRRLQIRLEASGPSVNLLDSRGGTRASFGFFQGEPSLVLYDASLRVRGVVAMAKDKPSIVFLDENRRQVYHAP